MKHQKFLNISIISLLLFLILLFTFPFFSRLDSMVNTSLPHPQIITSISKLIDLALDTIPLFIISMILSAALWLKNKKPQALQLALTMAADAAILFIIKLVVARPRPLNALISAYDNAFPSGHTTSAVVFFGLLTYLLTKKKPSTATIAASTCLVIIIAASRLFLNVHWLTDVIGGLLLGTSILAASIFIRKSS
jgi:membrane-associated phospholipid phosphatase